MPPTWSEPSRQPLPLILVRGFGGLGVEDEKRIAYQGFNDGTVYPQKRGENYIYEGLVLRFIKSHWRYHDATNVVGYYREEIATPPVLPEQLGGARADIRATFKRLEEAGFFSGDRVIIDPAMAFHLLTAVDDIRRSMWVFRYYDLDARRFPTYGRALVRLIDFIRELGTGADGALPKVNIIAHSMGGLLVREAVQSTYPTRVKAWTDGGKQGPAPAGADESINKIVTLGTPHQGISFQVLERWLVVDAREELERFNPTFQADLKQPTAYGNLGKVFPLERVLTVVGTNYRSYAVGVAAAANRLFSVSDEFGMNYNRSDGLVKQTYAQIPGAPRTFVHKCHGGPDSLVTSREAFEIATRFFFGNIHARLRLVSAKVLRGKDLFGKSEFFFGVSIKPRRVDFDLFQQSPEAENCYGPFSQDDLNDPSPNFGWAGPDRLIWEGWLDVRSIMEDKSVTRKDMVIRLDFYVGERDLLGIGFSDNVVFRKQYYLRAALEEKLKVFLHTNEEFMAPAEDPRRHPILPPQSPDDQAASPAGWPMDSVNGGWEFPVRGTGFEATLRAELESVPEIGRPTPLTGVTEL
jgi:hypothetical protein